MTSSGLPLRVSAFLEGLRAPRGSAQWLVCRMLAGRTILINQTTSPYPVCAQALELWASRTPNQPLSRRQRAAVHAVYDGGITLGVRQSRLQNPLPNWNGVVNALVEQGKWEVLGSLFGSAYKEELIDSLLTHLCPLVSNPHAQDVLVKLTHLCAQSAQDAFSASEQTLLGYAEILWSLESMADKLNATLKGLGALDQVGYTDPQLDERVRSLYTNLTISPICLYQGKTNRPEVSQLREAFKTRVQYQDLCRIAATASVACAPVRRPAM